MRDWADDLIGRTYSRVAKRLQRSAERAEAKRLVRQMKSCGRDFRLNGRATITGLNQLSVGNNVHIGDNAYIRAEGGLAIGDNTHISRNLLLYTVNHRFRDAELLPYDETLVLKPVSIGRNVWVGMNVCIAPGATIGDGAIIGMGAVVAGDVEPLAIVGSQPLRVLSHRDKDHYDRLDEAGLYGGVNGRRLESRQSQNASVAQ